MSQHSQPTKMTAEIAMFLATVINFENYRYSYGRKMNQKRIAETEIKLPHNEKNKIDRVYIESYIKGLPHSKYLDITP